MELQPQQQTQLATWLTITLAQRERQLTKFLAQYGSDSPIILQLRTEISDINSFIQILLQPPLPLHATQPTERDTRKK